jgi:hypothetical protein
MSVYLPYLREISGVEIFEVVNVVVKFKNYNVNRTYIWRHIEMKAVSTIFHLNSQKYLNGYLIISRMDCMEQKTED